MSWGSAFAASPVAGPVLGSLATGLFNQRSANKQMRFQDAQSRTQYQRAVADMKAAGLNPMLATKLGGNAAMSGAQATMPDLGATINSAQSISNQAKVQEAQVGKINQEIVNLGLESVAKGMDNMQKEMLLMFEKSLSSEAYKLYKMPIMKALAEALKAPEVVVELSNSEVAGAVKGVAKSVLNPVKTFENVTKYISKKGKEFADKNGRDGFQSLQRAIEDIYADIMTRN